MRIIRSSDIPKKRKNKDTEIIEEKIQTVFDVMKNKLNIQGIARCVTSYFIDTGDVCFESGETKGEI